MQKQCLFFLFLNRLLATASRQGADIFFFTFRTILFVITVDKIFSRISFVVFSLISLFFLFIYLSFVHYFRFLPYPPSFSFNLPIFVFKLPTFWGVSSFEKNNFFSLHLSFIFITCSLSQVLLLELLPPYELLYKKGDIE